MRHLRKFDTQTNYNNVKSSLALPNMCLLNDIYEIASEGDEDIVPIEYLKGASGTRIDTGISGGDSIKIEIKYNISAHEQYGAVFGNYIDENINCFRLICQSSNSNNGYINVNTKAGSSAALPNGVTKNKDIIAVVSKTNITIDGTSITPPTTNGNNNTTNIALFSKSTTFSPPGTMGVKIYYCKILNNDVLVRDFIPVRIGTVGYLYDKVSKKLFGNVGTGNFILGQDVDLLKFKNVITNGYGEMLNNYNFSGFTFDSSDCPNGCSGSFVCNTKTSKYTNKYIPLRRGSTLKLKYWVKNTTSCTNYDFIAQYDSDKKEITYDNWHWVPGSTTYLTQPLNNGDTVVHLANVSVYKTTTNTSNGFIIWNYKNSSGYEYPKETYSRNIYASLWNNASTDINTTNNTITLKTAWNKGNIPAGTFVSHCQYGNTYHYGNIGYKTTVDTWVEKSATFNTTTANSLSKGTAYIKIGWLINYSNVAGNIFKVSGVRLVQEKHI